MHLFKNKRIFTPLIQLHECQFCNKEVDKLSSFNLINKHDNSLMYAHLDCLNAKMDITAKNALEKNIEFDFKTSCICCYGPTHLPEIENNSLFELGLNPITLSTFIGKSKRKIKMHEACLSGLFTDQKLNYDQLFSKAKIHHLKVLPPVKTLIKNPICPACKSDVSTKKGIPFITNNKYFHQSCLNNLIQDVFEMKTSNAHLLNYEDLRRIRNSCIFCRKPHSIDNISIQPISTKHPQTNASIEVGFHRECLLALSA